MKDRAELIREIEMAKELVMPIVNNFYERTDFQISSISVCNVYEKTNCGEKHIGTTIDITIKP